MSWDLTQHHCVTGSAGRHVVNRFHEASARVYRADVAWQVSGGLVLAGTNLLFGLGTIVVIGLGILLAVACYGMLTVTRLSGRSYQEARDMREAEVLAESAVQRAAAIFAKE